MTGMGTAKRTAPLVALGVPAVLAALLAVAGGAGTGTAAADTGAQPSGARDVLGPGVVAAAEAGPVDVVVMLDGETGSNDVAALERSSARAQQQTLDRLPVGSVEVRHRFQTIPAFVARVDAEALDALADDPNVVKVDLDDVGGTGSLANTVPIIGADDLQAAGTDGAGVTVAVLDSGADLDHPDLAGAVVYEACFGRRSSSGFCHNGTDRHVGPGAAEDDAGHGTHVTGIVTSDGVVSSVGVAPGTSIVALKVLDDCGFSGCFYAFSEVTAALDHLVAHPELGVDVVNMSIGTGALFAGDCDTAMASFQAAAAVVANLNALGVVLAASAANNGSTTTMSAPACLSGVVAVGATNTADVLAGFSNTSTGTDLLAPGVGVVSDAIGGGTTTASGTSMASPAVAGCVALLRDRVPGATPAELEAALESTGTAVTTPQGPRPRINCDAAADQLDPPGDVLGDFDDDGRTDIAVFRPTTGRWYLEGTPGSVAFGVNGDIPVPANYDADPEADIAVFRPTTGRWYIDGTPGAVAFGLNGDVPVPGQWDGDPATDIAVYRPTTGRWYIDGIPGSIAFGISGDIPLPANYDADPETDIAVYRPTTGRWYIDGVPGSIAFGVSGDIPVPADYDADPEADIAVFRPSAGRWYVHGTAGATAFGLDGDIPVPGEWDGDPTTDIAVYRPTTGRWYLEGTPGSIAFGAAGDLPVPRRPHAL